MRFDAKQNSHESRPPEQDRTRPEGSSRMATILDYLSLRGTLDHRRFLRETDPAHLRSRHRRQRLGDENKPHLRSLGYQSALEFVSLYVVQTSSRGLRQSYRRPSLRAPTNAK